METSEKFLLLNELLSILKKKLDKENKKLCLIKITVHREDEQQQELLVATLHQKIIKTKNWIQQLTSAEIL